MFEFSPKLSNVFSRSISLARLRRARVTSPPNALDMPQIQYSEKYYDDVYEYRCVYRVASTRLTDVSVGFREVTNGLLTSVRVVCARPDTWFYLRT